MSLPHVLRCGPAVESIMSDGNGISEETCIRADLFSPKKIEHIRELIWHSCITSQFPHNQLTS